MVIPMREPDHLAAVLVPIQGAPVNVNTNQGCQMSGALLAMNTPMP